MIRTKQNRTELSTYVVTGVGPDTVELADGRTFECVFAVLISLHNATFLLAQAIGLLF